MKIEEMLFKPIGGYPYRYSEVKNLRPESNVHGLTYIQGKYYEKVYESI